MPNLTLTVTQCCIFGQYCRFDVNHLKFDIGIMVVTLTPGSGQVGFLSEDQDNLQKELSEACHRWAVYPFPLFLHSPGQRHSLPKPMEVPTGGVPRDSCSLCCPASCLCSHICSTRSCVGCKDHGTRREVFVPLAGLRHLVQNCLRNATRNNRSEFFIGIPQTASPSMFTALIFSAAGGAG